MTTNITEEHKDWFTYVRHCRAQSVALFSCFLNGKPTSVISAIVPTEEGRVITIRPMFVAVTADMNITDHDGREPEPLDERP